jgi:hypothetical protein
MKKLRLDFDDLHVESFATANAGESQGTVNAHASFRNSCNPANTCDYHETCGGWDSCFVTCIGSCPCEPDDPTFYATNCDTCAQTYCNSCGASNCHNTICVGC